MGVCVCVCAQVLRWAVDNEDQKCFQAHTAIGPLLVLTLFVQPLALTT